MKKSLSNNAIICLGANTPDAAEQLAQARTVLETLGTVKRQTEPYPTAPEYVTEGPAYLNQLIELETTLTYQSLHDQSKDFEGDVRRFFKAGKLVPIDIDIVIWNGKILRPADAKASYFKEGLSKLQ